MKKSIYLIISVVLAFVSFSACTQKQELVEPASSIRITATDLAIPAKGGSAYVKFESDNPVTVNIDREWCTSTVTDDAVLFTAAENLSLETRYAKATVSTGKESMEFTIEQFGYKTTTFKPEDIVSPATSAEGGYDFPYEYDELMVATADQEWIHVTVTEDNLHIDLDENTVQGTPENPSRTGTVKWALGIDSGTIFITQKNLSFMKLDDNWKVFYAGRGVDETFGEEVDYITNEVTDPTVSGTYMISYASKSDVVASGLEIGDFISDVAYPNVKAQLDLMVMIYSLLTGQEGSYDLFLYNDTYSELFDPLSKGDYYAFAVGIDNEGKLTGHYQASEFKIAGAGDRPATGYKSWIGDWTVKRGSVTDTWTITKDVEGSTYKIAGIEGDPCQLGPITAYYDAANDALVLKAVPDIATVSTQSGDRIVGLYATVLYQNQDIVLTTNSSNPYTITTITHTDYEHAALAASPVKTSVGDLMTSSIIFAGNIPDDDEHVSVFGQEHTALPSTMVAVEGTGGGDEPGGGGSDAYNKWLGTWTDPDGGVYTVSQKVADQTFNIAGFDVNGGRVAEAQFDSSTGKMLLCGQDMGSDSEYSYILAGIDSEDYVERGDSKNGYLLATGAVSSDGKTAKFTGNEYDAVYGGENWHELIVNVQFFGIDSQDDVYSFKGNPTLNMGATLTKKSTTSNFMKIAGRMFSRISPDPIQHKALHRPDLIAYPAKSVSVK